MPNLEKFPTSASHAIRTSTPYQHAQRENRRRAVSYVSTGLACLPRDTDAHASTAEERLYKYHRHIHRRGATAFFRNPVRGAKRMRAGILRILQISRAGGTPLPMAGRLTQLAKIFPVIYTTALRR